LEASHEHEAGTLASHGANGAKDPGWVLLNLGMLSAYHHDCHHLSKYDHDASEDGCFLRVEPLEQDAWQNTK